MNPRLMRPYKEGVPASLLLRFDGTNGSTAFTDSSPNGLTVTANGDAEISTAQSKFGAGAAISGGGGYVSVSASSALDMGTGDFTIEYWAYLADSQSVLYPAHVATTSSYQPGVVAVGFSRSDNPGKVWAFYDTTSGGPDWFGLSSVMETSQWHHIAVTRSGTTMRLFVDGIVEASAEVSASDVVDLALGGAMGICGGSWDGASSYTNDYIDDLRIVKGLAVYTGPFIPPSAPLSPYAKQVAVSRQASLLLHMDGTNGSTTFTDSSQNALTVTAYGDAEISTAQGKWGGASMYVADSANDGVTFHADATDQFQFVGDYTIEFWLYRVSGADDTSLYLTYDGSNYHAINIDGSNFNLYFNSTSPDAVIAHSIGLDAWAHVALVRSGDQVTLYVDGVSIGSATSSVTHGYATPTLARTGGGNIGSEMYIDDLRVVRGLAVYTGPFVPPTGPLPALATPQPIQAQASLLLHFDGANESTTFTDSSQNALTVTASGNAEISTAQSQWGGSSGYFDADTGTYASISSFPGFDGAGDFTIEMWIYANTITPWQPLLGTASSASGNLQFALNPDGDDTDGIGLGQQNVAYFTASPAGILLNTWHHIACVRSGNTLRYFVDGTQVGSDIDVTGQTFPIGDLYIANHNIGATEYPFNGYIDDLRIVRGLAVYQGPYTPPTGPLGATVTPQ